MKIKIRLLSIAMAFLVLIAVASLGASIGTTIADNCALQSIYSGNQVDIVCALIEYENNTKIVKTLLFKKEELLLIEDENGSIYYFKPKKVASFRYEWVEVLENGK